MRAGIVALALALVLASSIARTSVAAPEARKRVDGFPCAGCVTSWTERDQDETVPAPLLVVLHGDYGENAAGLHRAWEPHVAARGIALLSLACPASEGCKGSWWRWDGDPAWIDRQVDALATKVSVDRDRMWLAGWSGGASYAGYRTHELERRFAAFVMHGGGMPPSSAACDGKTSVLFLVGDANPLHGLAVRLRDHYAACGDDVAWNVMHGVDHPDEWKALASRGGSIVRWLEQHPRAAKSTATPTPTAPATPTPTPTATSTPTPTPPLPPRHSGCACTAAAAPAAPPVALLFAIAAITRLRRRAPRP